jgi:hypothetical protein
LPGDAASYLAESLLPRSILPTRMSAPTESSLSINARPQPPPARGAQHPALLGPKFGRELPWCGTLIADRGPTWRRSPHPTPVRAAHWSSRACSSPPTWALLLQRKELHKRVRVILKKCHVYLPGCTVARQRPPLLNTLIGIPPTRILGVLPCHYRSTSPSTAPRHGEGCPGRCAPFHSARSSPHSLRRPCTQRIACWHPYPIWAKLSALVALPIRPTLRTETLLANCANRKTETADPRRLKLLRLTGPPHWTKSRIDVIPQSHACCRKSTAESLESPDRQVVPTAAESRSETESPNLAKLRTDRLLPAPRTESWTLQSPLSLTLEELTGSLHNPRKA